MKKSFTTSFLLSVALAVIANVAYSQNDSKPGTVKSHMVAGIVFDAQGGDPLPGVNVILQGNNKGVATDVNGKFNFPTPLNEGETLMFTFVGLETQFYKIGATGSDDIRIVMDLDKTIIMEAAANNEVYVPKKGFVGTIKGWFR